MNDPEEGDTDISLPPSYRQQLKEKYGKDPKALALYALGCCGATATVKIAAYAAIAIGAAALLLSGGGGLGRKTNVAFIGNSIFFVNDLPRLMEKVSGDHIHQDSCLHTSGSILNILKTGNGMYNKWQTQNAMINGVEWVSREDNTVTYLYDYGACSVPQLLTGQDNMLSYGNQYGHYIDDGSNPCLMENDYLDYQASFNYSKPWDYVVIVDQAKRMCFDDAREEALLAFNYTYGPLIDKLKATPVIVQPHAFWSYNVNMTGLVDVPTFTSMIIDGAQIYKDYMNTKLSGAFRSTKIAPVGTAFLAVWEEDEDLWNKLFLDDGIHPSGYGSYLYSMVIHATIYRAMPPKSRVVIKDTMDLFSSSRRLYVNETGVPSKQEARKLWKIARKVTLLGFTPKSLKKVGSTSALEEQQYDDEAMQQDEAEYEAEEEAAEEAADNAN